MISELNDKEILEFLMTSDFEDDYSPSELKYLLIKWRYFYRLKCGQSDRQLEKSEFEIKKLEDFNSSLSTESQKLKNQIEEKENLIKVLKNRNLTWKERLSGKIIIKENEN